MMVKLAPPGNEYQFTHIDYVIELAIKRQLEPYLHASKFHG
jgi:hypothetical protein